MCEIHRSSFSGVVGCSWSCWVRQTVCSIVFVVVIPSECCETRLELRCDWMKLGQISFGPVMRCRVVILTKFEHVQSLSRLLPRFLSCVFLLVWVLSVEIETLLSLGCWQSLPWHSSLKLMEQSACRFKLQVFSCLRLKWLKHSEKSFHDLLSNKNFWNNFASCEISYSPHNGVLLSKFSQHNHRLEPNRRGMRLRRRRVWNKFLEKNILYWLFLLELAAILYLQRTTARIIKCS